MFAVTNSTRRYGQPRAAVTNQLLMESIQIFDSADQFNAHMGEPDFPSVMEDIEKFMDSSNIQWILTEEPNLVIDN